MAALRWFEIPVTDLERAVQFYSTVFNMDVPIKDKRSSHGSLVGVLIDQNGIVGTLTYNNRTPSTPSQTAGIVIYLDVGKEGMDIVLNRVEEGGGQILLPKVNVEKGGKQGTVAWILDSEGNKIGLMDYGPSGF